MNNLILATTTITAGHVIVYFIEVFCIIFLIGFLYGIVDLNVIKPILLKKNYKKACKNQHLMFNQLKNGDFIWEVVGSNVFGYVISSISHSFDPVTNKCHRINFDLKRIDNKYSVRWFDIKVDSSKSFKHHNYYTLFGEANSIATMTKNKRDSEIAKISEVSNDEINKEVDNVIERLNDFKKKL